MPNLEHRNRNDKCSGAVQNRVGGHLVRNNYQRACIQKVCTGQGVTNSVQEEGCRNRVEKETWGEGEGSRPREQYAHSRGALDYGVQKPSSEWLGNNKRRGRECIWKGRLGSDLEEGPIG